MVYVPYAHHYIGWQRKPTAAVGTAVSETFVFYKEETHAEPLLLSVRTGTSLLAVTRRSDEQTLNAAIYIFPHANRLYLNVIPI